MTLSDHSLRQIDEESIDSLSEDAVRALAIKLLNDLKEARERLNRNSQNSSVPPGSGAPWEKGSKYSDDEDDADALLDPEGIAESDSDSSEEDHEEQQPEESSQAQATEKNGPARKPGKQPGAQGFGRVETIPLHGQEHHHPDSCALCGQAFSEQTGRPYTAFDQLDIQWGDADRPGIAVFNTRHVYYESECQCGHTTREAPCRQPPDELLERVELSQWRLVGPGLAALIVCLFYRIRLSRQRIREFLHDWFGITLSVGTINKVIHESGRAAMPVEDELVSELRQSTLAYVDETSWHERMRLLWLWVFVSATAVVYWIAHRTEELIKTVLGEQEYKGWLMSDGYAVYRQFLKRLRCWAHLLRKARGLAESLDRPTQDFGKKTLELLHTLMDAVKDAREKPPDQALSQLYQEQLDDYRRACERVEASAPTEKARKLAVEMLSDWEVIFTILDNPHLPLTNNEAERALRHCVILRRISHGTKTHQGSRIFAILASVIETCRLRGRSPWRYLEAVIAAGRAGLPVPALPVAA
jgi:transposase